MPAPRLPPAVRAAAARLYGEGLTGPQVASVLHCDPSFVLTCVREAGGRVRGVFEAARTHALDLTALDRPSPDRLYWLGYLLAAAYVMRNGGNLVLRVDAKDANHLMALRSFLGFSGPLRAGQRGPSLQIASTPLVRRLRGLGFVRGRPMPEAFAHSPLAWRGAVDGRGWVTWEKGVVGSIGLAGSRSLCDQFAAGGGPHRGAWRVEVCGDDAVALWRFLYSSPGPALARHKCPPATDE